jgi:hypothetical protein
MSKKLFAVLGLLVIFSLVLVACGNTNTPVNEPANVPANEPADQPADEPADEPAAPVRQGGWLDTLSLSVVSADSAVTQIEAGAIDVYGSNLSTPADFQAIADAGLDHSFQYGLYYELTFNPVGPVFEGTGKLNPFSSMKIREAMNWLVDRDYINQEIYGGNAIPKFFSLVAGFPEYGRYIDLIRPYEVIYAPDRAKATAVITEEMTAMGAEMVDGLWTFEGEPVEIIFLIRTDSDGTRRPMGDIISNWLEEEGFTVDRQYKTSSEASALWIGTDPADGQWTLYTGAWGSSAVSRDNADDFQFFLSPSSGYGFTGLWQSYIMEPEEQQVFDDLANKLYKDMTERRAMYEEAFAIAMKYSFRVWVVDGRGQSPWTPEMTVSFDLSAGVDINTLYPFTMRRVGEEGGLVRMGEPDLFIDPANPIGGSNWTYDSVWQIPTQDYDAVPNPYTGLTLPQRLEKAEVVLQTGLPVDQTYDWVDLSFSDDIVPPDDAWVNWDVETETFLTVADWKATVSLVDGINAAVADAAAGVDFATLDVDGVVATMQAVAGIYAAQTGKEIDFTDLIAAATAVPEADPEAEEEEDLRPLIEIRLEGILGAEDQAAALTEYALEWLQAADVAGLFEFAGYDYTSAKRKVTYYYPADMFATVTWHDGSPMSIGDFVMPMIMGFATGKAGSPLYDDAAAGALAASLDAFKGQKIVSTDPLVIELYSDAWFGDAELNAVPFRTAFWPEYGYGQSSWGMIAVANKAEENFELAYTQDKADANEIEWMNWIGGPSLEILSAKLDEAIAENYIPFESTFGQFVTADEAALRYANLKAFYEEYGHFWVGAGPYILKDVFQVEKTATLIHNPNFSDPADKWAMFSSPMVAELTLDGAGRVTIGEEAVFDVFIDFEGAPYPADQVTEIKYLLFDSNSNLVEVGAAEFVAEGQYQVTLSAATTGLLQAGANKLEVVSIVIPVAIPTIAAFEFVSE